MTNSLCGRSCVPARHVALHGPTCQEQRWRRHSCHRPQACRREVDAASMQRSQRWQWRSARGWRVMSSHWPYEHDVLLALAPWRWQQQEEQQQQRVVRWCQTVVERQAASPMMMMMSWQGWQWQMVEMEMRWQQLWAWVWAWDGAWERRAPYEPRHRGACWTLAPLLAAQLLVVGSSSDNT